MNNHERQVIASFFYHENNIFFNKSSIRCNTNLNVNFKKTAYGLWCVEMQRTTMSI